MSSYESWSEFDHAVTTSYHRTQAGEQGADQMSIDRRRRFLHVIACLIALTTSVGLVWLFQEDEYLRIHSPNGQHTAIVTYRRYESLLPMFPGQSGDKAGSIRIEDVGGLNYGKIGVPMVTMSRDLEWTADGARLKFVGEWVFSNREYRYWNKAQTEEVVKSAR